MTVAYSNLPTSPDKPSDFKQWKDWAENCFQRNRFPRFSEGDAADPIAALAMRAILGWWAGKRGPGFEDIAPTAQQFLREAHTVPPAVLRVAALLVRRAMDIGVTTSDVLYLCSAFAWPLRDLEPELSDRSWMYLAQQPWQTDAPTLAGWCRLVDKSGALDDDRSLIDLVDARIRWGHADSAREVLEAIALVQAGANALHLIPDAKAFAANPKLSDAERGLVRLAREYLESGEVEVHAREVMKRAAVLDSDSADLVSAVRDRVWDLPFQELYNWAEMLTSVRALEARLARIIASEQPHLARRATEAVIVSCFNRSRFGDARSNLEGAFEAYWKADERQILSNDVARCAVEHLTVLYPKTNCTTMTARDFVMKTLKIVPITGAGGSLYGIREDLERFVAENDPFLLLREEDRLLADASRHFTRGERIAEEKTSEWFDRQRNQNAFEGIITAITCPMRDLVGRLNGYIPGVETACANAFGLVANASKTIAGNLDEALATGRSIQADDGYGERLMNAAMEMTRTERFASMAVSAVSNLLPPGVNYLAAPADITVAILASMRAIARIGALYGIDVRDPANLRFVADSFALGCSSNDGEGIAAYLSGRPRNAGNSVKLGGITYAATRTGGYLWSSGAVGGEAVRHLSRLICISLSRRGAAKVIPVAGAVLSGWSAYAFVAKVAEAAVHVASRQALLRKATESQ